MALPTIVHAHARVEDAPEIMDIEIPSASSFRAIKRLWVRADLSEKRKKAKNFTLSAKKLEKLANRSQKKKTNSALRSTILDFFSATSPEWNSETKFTKPRDWEDLQLFTGKNTLVDAITRTTLQSSAVYTGALLVQRPPIAASLERRDFIASLIEKDDLASQMRNALQTFVPHEEGFFSNSMQEEDEAIKVAIEGLQPGWFVKKVLPKKLFSENPTFLRFHAAITQKTAPYFWNPLMQIYDTGSSFSNAGVGMLLLFWRLNGISQTIVRDFVTYAAFEAQKSNELNIEAIPRRERTKARFVINLAMFTAKRIIPYVFTHLFPFKHGLPTPTALRAGAGIVNDMFLWPLSELRLALAQQENNPQAITPPPAGAGLMPNERPIPLGDGPHYSLWMNGQYNKSIFLKVLHAGATRFHKWYFKQNIPTDVALPKGWLGTAYFLLRNQAEVLSGTNTITGNTHLDASIQRASNAVIAGDKAIQAAGSVAAAVNGNIPQATEGALKIAAHAIKGTFQAARQRLPRTSGVLGRVFSALDDIRNRGIAQTERHALEAARDDHAATTLPNINPGGPSRVATLDVKTQCAEQLSKDAIRLLGSYSASAAQPKRHKPWKSMFSIILYAIMTKYLWNLWRTRNHADRSKVDTLDKVMFAAAQPAMTLLAVTSTILETITANKGHLPIPTSLATKIARFEARAKTTSKEFFALAQRPGFKKETGHRLSDHTGEVRRAYTLLQQKENRALLEEALHLVSELDTYLGIATLAKEYSTGDNQLCPVNFISADTPFINAKNAWFALLGKTAIGSDILMGNGNPTNILLTGWNGGGKSVMLKTCVFTLVLAHVFGYTTAQQCSMTPFSELNLHMSSLDNTAEGKSRWVAEAEAIGSMKHSAESIHSPHYFVLILGDELGDGTAPDASIQVMVKLLTSISQHKNVLSFISSHLQPLTELEKVLPRLTNYRINPQRKLEPGINTTNIALNIFEKFSNTKQKADGYAAALAQQTAQQPTAVVK